MRLQSRVGAALIGMAVLGSADAAHAGPPTRRAFLVGSHEGNPDQARLRYTTDDVHRLASVLKELGGVPTGAITELVDPSATQVTASLESLAQSDNDIFVFYYSGHADGGSLSLGGTSLPLTDLMAKIAAIPASMRIIVLDACQSGAATRAKGVSIAEPFDVEVRAAASSGDVLITSSSATEASYEADASRAGVFSLHLATALRGAGDLDRDGAVTVSEAYRYAYEQTVRATMLSRGGAQHPSFRYAVEGQREPVLTWVGASSRLTLRALEEGDFVLFDAPESHVIAEVRVGKERSSRLALAPGQYVVRKRGERDLRSARIALAANDDRVLDEGQMPATPLLRLPPKGGLGNFGLGVSVGQYWSALGEQGHAQLQIGPEWERATWLFRADAVVTFGTQENTGLETHEQAVGVALSALTGIRLGGAFLRLGPFLAPEMILQQPKNRPSRSGFGVRGGPRIRLDIPVSRNIALYTQADGGIFGTQADRTSHTLSSQIGELGLFAWWSYGIGVGSAW